MHIVWHGSYALYFEDAREEFGRVFGLSYSSYVENGCYEADTLIATGSSTQVFLDLNYHLIWTNPPFYEAWKIRHGQL